MKTPKGGSLKPVLSEVEGRSTRFRGHKLGDVCSVAIFRLPSPSLRDDAATPITRVKSVVKESKKKSSNVRSAEAFAEACRFLPGGVNSPVRAFGGVDATPIFIERATGSKIYDIDGNEYIDYVGSWGPMILGHAHPKVIEAVKIFAQKGTSFGAPTLAETALAKKIATAFDSIEKVRLVSSGTEAVMTAIRLARA